MNGTVGRRGAALGLVLVLVSAQAASATQKVPAPVELDALIRGLGARSGMERLRATRELFRLGATTLAALEGAGAQELSTAQASRLDAVYSLIRGLSAEHVRPDSFGIIADSAATRADIVAMGKRDGFRLPDAASFTLGMFPTCYVRIDRSQPLSEIMRRVLENERLVISVTLNRADP